MKDPNPAAASNNRHHMGGYRTQAEFDEELFGRGAGDPDHLGHYPGEPVEVTIKQAPVGKLIQDVVPF